MSPTLFLLNGLLLFRLRLLILHPLLGLLLAKKVDLIDIADQLLVVVFILVVLLLTLGFEVALEQKFLVLILHGVHRRVVKSLQTGEDQVGLLRLRVDER